MADNSIQYYEEVTEIDEIELLDSDEDYTSDDYDDDYDQQLLSAQQQWDESMKQIQSLLSFVVFPLIGKLLGRRFSKIIWRRVANWIWR
ncbi:unnamed protein product [Candida verbasci]|uniref:Uncharacterized protein n=1 Tax=Candida verbasci TaxID=1227364 RepID=A0A9W4XEK8_9ASCO|nr:unnamed protein product [Candida verbasci]